ncbi:hypothetical protein NKDENANG_00877 [Candidatus Entotheonellaceae bacterium PAL068K]
MPGRVQPLSLWRKAVCFSRITFFSHHDVILLAILMLTVQSGMVQSTAPAASAQVLDEVLAVINYASK